MAENDATFVVLIVVAIVAIVGLGLSVASFATDRTLGNMMGGGGSGMMNGGGGTTSTAATPGAFEWAVLVLSVALFAVVLVLLLRARGPRTEPPPVAPPAPASPAAPSPVEPPVEAAVPAPAHPVAASAPVPEPTLVKLLDEDERRMYIEIRSHGGEMFQRDLVALGMFSKAKVTRVLDKLETKGLVVREAHGMTNRVRLTGGAGR